MSNNISVLIISMVFFSNGRIIVNIASFITVRLEIIIIIMKQRSGWDENKIIIYSATHHSACCRKILHFNTTCCQGNRCTQNGCSEHAAIILKYNYVNPYFKFWKCFLQTTSINNKQQQQRTILMAPTIASLMIEDINFSSFN